MANLIAAQPSLDPMAIKPPWAVVFAADAINDLVLISQHLTLAYGSFGKPPAAANRHAQLRIEAPLRGESHDDLSCCGPCA